MSACTSSYEESLFATAFGLAFFGAFHTCKLVPAARNKLDGLLFDYVLFGTDLLHLGVS